MNQKERTVFQLYRGSLPFLNTEPNGLTHQTHQSWYLPRMVRQSVRWRCGH